MELIASGYALAEAPVAAPGGGVYFSDVLGGGAHRWSPSSGAVETVIPKRRGIGGMALHSDGGLVVSGRDLSHVGEGGTATLYADESAAGFNDLTVDPEGALVVGVLRFRPFAGEEPVAGEYVTVGSEGQASEVIGGVEWPNGCAFSPDGATFYGCDYRRGIVLAADRLPDGAFGEARVAFESPSGEADGMAVDENGGVWIALGGAAAVARFLPDGTLEQRIDVPADFVASLCFGGDGLREIFITTGGEDGGVYVTPSPVAGMAVPAVSG